MTDAALDKPIITLPEGNDHRVDGHSVIDMAQAEALSRRILELGGNHGFHMESRRPTDEEQLAFQEGRLLGHSRDKPRDRHDRVIIVYIDGPVEIAFREAGFGYPCRTDRRKVDVFLEVAREHKLRTERAARREVYEAKIEAFFAGVALSPAAERRLRAETVFGKRGAKLPEVRDLREHWHSRLTVATNPYGVKESDPPYVAEPSGFRLLLDQAISFSYTQDSYADYGMTLIPVEATQPTDVAAAKRNLAQISKKLNTHNGWAGSGTGYDLALVQEEDGDYVLMTARHSISD